MELLNLCTRKFNLCKFKLFMPLILKDRNTYILKRRHPPGLSKVGSPVHKRLKGRHHIYELVEDTDQIPLPDLHVVLTSFIEGVGNIGDVISVDRHYARNHLLLPKCAVYATPENIEQYSKMRKTATEPSKHSSIYSGMVVRVLEKKILPVFMSSETPWTIEPWHIHAIMKIRGINIPEYAIKMPSKPINGPDPTKEGKDFGIFITVNKAETICVRCRVFHIESPTTIQDLPEECCLGQADPILEEQNELLSSLPLPVPDDESESNVSLKEKYRIKLIQ